MFRVYTCVTQQHDLSLVLVAAAICLLACYTAFNLLPRAALAGSRARLWWICATAAAIGSGIWATHFIAMLAFLPNILIRHDVGMTVLSIVIAIVIAGLGLALVLRPGRTSPFLGGAVVGLGVSAMHYSGMAAWEMQGIAIYDARYVIASILIGTAGGSIAVATGAVRSDAVHRIAATGAMVLTIVAMHFTGMASVTILSDLTMPDVPGSMPPWALAVAVAAVTLFILALGLAGAILDERLTSHFAREAAALKEEVELRTAAQAALQQHRETLEQEVAARTAELAASEARLADAIETLPEAFAMFDAEDRLMICNALYRSLSGTTELYAKPGITFEELIRRAVVRGDHSLDGVDTEAWMRQRLAQHRAVGTDPVRTEQHRPDGRWMEIHEKRLRDGSLVCLQVDVTEIRGRIAKLAAHDKLTALGQLAGGVAHELNNLLQPALVYPEYIREALPPEDTETLELLQVMEDGVRKARDIVRSILLYARKERAALQVDDLVAATAAAIKFIRGLLPPGISLQADLADDAMPAAFNKTELTQVLSNLVLNAAHASDQRGVIEVRSGQAAPSKADILRLGLTADAQYATIAVTDQGCGMDAETLRRIFEPFFTTKPLGVGTGLGLSVVHGILRSWNGAIDVESTPGIGTRFTLYIPIEQEQAADGEVPVAAVRAATG